MTTYKTTSGDYVLTSNNGNGLVTINGNTTFNGNITANGLSTFNGNTTFNGNITANGWSILDGNTTANNITANTVFATDSLLLPGYTTAQANALSNKQGGSLIAVSDGNSGAPCLAIWSGTAWLRIPLGNAISST